MTTESALRGKRIRGIRKRLGLNQEQLGEKLGGVTKGSVSGYESGDTNPTPEALIELARLGGVSLDWLLTGKEQGSGQAHPAEQKGEIAASIEPGAKGARDRLIKQRAAALTGRATQAQQSPPAKSDQPGQHPLTEKIDIHEGLLMTTRVLQSETGYAVALWSNLKSFDEAVKKEEKVKDLERKMDLMLEKMSKMEERLAEKSGGTEKRDAANHS